MSVLFILLASIIGVIACKKYDVITPTNTEQPVGAFTATRTGSLVSQIGKPSTAGTVQLGTDTKNIVFLKLGSNFKSDFRTGAVTLNLSKGAVYKAETVQLIGGVNKYGEQYFKVTPSVGNDFTHLIVWCNAAKIPFGNAELK